MDAQLEQLKNSQTLRLYHGSRGGLQGDIQPCSRERCDFGKGFYMGTMREQAEMLICEDADPIMYEMDFHLENIPPERILQLDNHIVPFVNIQIKLLYLISYH